MSPPKPWSLLPNGDFMELHICQKGKHAVKATWVKGHAKQEHIDKGITTARFKLFNDRVDEVARKGVSLHGDCVVQLADAYKKRMALSVAVLPHFHSMIIRVLVASEAKCKSEAQARVQTLGGKGLRSLELFHVLKSPCPEIA